MNQHLIDTPPRLGTCVRCGALVLTGLVAGAWAAVNTAPLAAEDLRALLVHGGRPYRLRMAAGRAQALTPASLGDIQARGPLLGAHTCGALPMDARSVQELPQNPACPPVSTTGHQDRPYASGQAHRGTQTLAPATRATPRRSRRCDICRRSINPGAPYWGIECGQYLWAVHDACPEIRSNDKRP